MTIKVEQQALLRVLSRGRPAASSASSSSPSSPRDPLCDGPIPDEEFVIVDLPKSLDSVPDERASPLKPQRDHDEPSVCTLSTDSLSTDSESISRRVSFATPLVTAEWTRPWTPREDVSMLYYSTEETTRFRQEYRLERKVLSELSIDPEDPTVPTDDLSGLFTASPNNRASRHHISRVVVLHNDKIETFFNPDSTPVVSTKVEESVPFDGDFFDNDSFWSGSLTWY